MAKTVPDEATKKRISFLARVGTALAQVNTEELDPSYYYLVKNDLKAFAEGIDELELDHQSQKGMHDLIYYLNNKLEKRIKQLNNDSI